MKEPFYFYHLVNKDADMSNGLLSLKYLYDNKMFDLFDKYASKYKERIISSWNIDKFKEKNNLSREEIIEALDIFRGSNGASQIYFFKFPPYKELGEHMEDILKYKDIYRIDINDEEVKKNIKSIFYGYDMSNSDNKLLTRDYYENVTKSEYFSKYNDSEVMNFRTLNHISISFIDDKCDVKLLEKVNTNFEDINTPKELLTYMDEFINYGFVSDNKVISADNINFQKEFLNSWKLSINDELVYKKYGNCFDQVELERYFFDKKGIENYTIFMYFELPYENDYNMHSFLIFKTDWWYTFENADYLNKGIHKFKSKEEAINYKKEIFINYIKDKDVLNNLKVYEYNKPTKNMNINEFIDFILNNNLL